ncbi:MAG TPA: hypothetical protein VGG25_28280 [Streptosporangiaceae bacterium]
MAPPARPGPGRVSVTIPAAALDHISAADHAADDGCAHTTATTSYRPPATIRDLIQALDQTCWFPGCRQPAWRGVRA